MMNTVWSLDVPMTEAHLLLALADHADDDGNNVFPTVGYLAWKTNLTERGVRKMMARFRDRGVLIPMDRESGGRGRSVMYRLDLEPLPRKVPFPRERKGHGYSKKP